MEPARRLDAGDAPVGAPKARHLGVLDDVDAEPVGSARIAPRHRVVTNRSAAALQETTLDRKARVVVVEPGIHGADGIPVEKLGIDAVQPHGVAAPRIGIALSVRVTEIEDAALRDHRVVVDVLLEPLPELHARLVERDVAGKQIVRAHDRRVAADVAGADPALLDDGDVAQAVALGEIVGGRKAVPAATDDDDVIAWLRGGAAARPDASRIGRAKPRGGRRKSSSDQDPIMLGFRCLRRSRAACTPLGLIHQRAIDLNISNSYYVSHDHTRSTALPFDLHALEAFLAVCEAGSMAAAAKKLALTQPAVSQAIADLEARTGVTLFDRRVRPIALTPSGEVMRQRASALMSEARQITTAIRHTARGRLALIRAGLVDSLSRALTGPVAAFLAEHAEQVSMQSGLTAAHAGALLTRNLDLFIGVDDMSDIEGFDRFELVSEPYILLLPSRHRIPRSVAEIATCAEKLPFLRYSARSKTGMEIERHLRRLNLDLAARS